MTTRNRRDARSSARSAIPTVAYHSAHKPAETDLPAVDRWEGERCVAFVHDLMSSPTLPAEFDACDVLVADPPWQAGFDTFNQRAHIDGERTYAAFMARLADLVENVAVPTYLITGRHALTRLPKPDAVLPMMLNEYESVAISYRPGPEADGRYGVAPEFLHTLAQRYDVAGDFCCGYGRTGRLFLRSGKRAVLSDFNPECIGYIAEHADGWAT